MAKKKTDKFTPSYPTEDPSQYSKWVDFCRSEEALPWEQRASFQAGKRKQRCKRGDDPSSPPHVQIEGGRYAARYPAAGAYPPDKRHGGPSSTRGRPPRGSLPLTSAGSASGPRSPLDPATGASQRLKGENPIYSKRTQPARPMTRKGLSRAQRTADAIQRLSGREGKFLVPESAQVLIDAGMPAREARILVRRAGGKLRAVQDLVRDIDNIEVVASLLGILPDSLAISPQRDAPDSKHWLTLDGKFVEEIGVESPDGSFTVIFDSDAFDQLYSNALSQLPPSLPKADFRAFQFDVLADAFDAVSELTGRQGTVEILFYGGDEESRAIGSTPITTAGGVPARKVRYKNLNVPLDELPARLSGVAKRKKRKGRTSKPKTSARNNPMPSSDLMNLVFSKAYPASGEPSLVDVPGKPGRVYWPVTKLRMVQGKRERVLVGLKDADRRQAETWLGLAQSSRNLSRVTSGSAEKQIATMLQEGDGSRRQQSASVDSPAATLSMENPMSYWSRQYQKGPYGASRSIPAARRNAKKSKSKGKRKLKPLSEAKFRVVGITAQKLMHDVPNCDIDRAMKQAWAAVKSLSDAQVMELSRQKAPAPAQALSNPYFNGHYDNPVPGALIPAGYQWEDPTMVFTAVAPKRNPRNPKNPRGHKNAGRHVRGQLGGPSVKTRDHGAHYKGPYEAPRDYLLNMSSQALVADGSPAALAELDRRGRGPDGVKLAWKQQKKAANNPRTPRRSVPFRGARGQFSTGEAWTHGIQPVNRRNPGHTMVNKFNPDLDCCVCGGHIAKGEHMSVHPRMKGPRGGKKYCHPHCS